MKRVNLHRIIFWSGVGKASIAFSLCDDMAACIAWAMFPTSNLCEAFAALGCLCAVTGVFAALYPAMAERRDFKRSIRGDGYPDPL